MIREAPSSLSKKIDPQMNYTYDDVLLRPGHSEVMPSDVKLETYFSKNISMKIPLVSAAMDTVTEAPTAIVIAQWGGIGVIHKNLSFHDQAHEVEKVKKFEAGMIIDPITVGPEESLARVVELRKIYKITGMPVVNDDQKLVGILTGRDMQFESNLSLKVKDIMTPKERLITTGEGTTLDEAREILHRHRIEKLPVIDKKGKLQGLITIRDIKKSILFPDANKDTLGRLRVAAAIGVGDKEMIRAEKLVTAEADALVIDTAHGHSQSVLDMVKKIKKAFPKVDVVAGNVATKEACEALILAGVDGIKVGIGPGSICTTRVIAGIGVPQMSAVWECSQICLFKKIPFIADGGIKFSGDIVKALAGGASSVMIGSLFAGTDESPGEMVLYQGRSYKVYRGMGSLGAMARGSKDRYGQGHIDESNKLVPEGIEGQVPYRGSLASNIFQMCGGIRSGMGYIGAHNLLELQELAKFIVISQASLKEGHPHDIIITKEAPNYSLQ